ncbi:MAG TPA: M1 family aminopeptidase [Chitinophagaceae bacterium]|nr:M1 family aminopeptidase [Chitinophagaceae bacterium]
MPIRILFFLILFLPPSLHAQQDFDVLHYRYEILLSDASDSIHGMAAVKVRILKNGGDISLDLDLPNQDGTGMHPGTITGQGVENVHRGNDILKLSFRPAKKAGDTVTILIPYRGLPANGLIIAKNKFGRRTFFADNWPNRAHHWVPCRDDPSDKASVEFIVTAPPQYEVVSNGIKVEESSLDGGRKRTHWLEEIPLPTKVMVIGVAEFATGLAGEVNGVPVWSWVYPEERDKGFYDYAVAVDILRFFSDYIGPYPYRKLANVQSKTMFGGMENASAIFYSESSVTGQRESEGLIAHEIAHQWFGNMATEKHFSHLWLSEGFASYLTHIYLETRYGLQRLQRGLAEDRQQVIEFVKTSTRPVVDSLSPFFQLLNPNSYQKGSWILHMLRRQVGDSTFRRILREYYERFRGKNADSRDFQSVAEQVSRRNLDGFFRQWLHRAGIPKLQVNWKYNSKQKTIGITVMQQTAPFSFPLQIAVREGTATRMLTLSVSRPVETFQFSAKRRPDNLILDPMVSLLFEGTITEVR